MQELVIKIPEEKLNIIKNKMYCGIYDSDLYEIIANGIPLPKGHGRLIDADILRSMYSINRANFNTVVGIQKWIDDVPTIIEGSEA